MLFRVVLAVAVLVIFVYGLVDVIRTDGRLTRGISKPAWIVVMIVLPVLGAILWLLIGRPRGKSAVRYAPSHPTAPDDDPDFLRNLELRRRKQAEAARLKKLKDDLESKAKADGGPAGSVPEGTNPEGPHGRKEQGLGGDGSGHGSGDADTRDTGELK